MGEEEAKAGGEVWGGWGGHLAAFSIEAWGFVTEMLTSKGNMLDIVARPACDSRAGGVKAGVGGGEGGGEGCVWDVCGGE